MLSFLALHVLDRDIAVSSGSVIDAFARVGITEEAVRSTLARMVSRDLLERHRRGRKMYFGLTPRSTAVLRDGYDRVWSQGALNHDWDGTWTVIGFSLPETWRRERHDLRSRLVWAGFGPLLGGMWVTPGRVAVTDLVAELDLVDRVKVFEARAVAPTEAGSLVNEAFDVPGIADRYNGFLARWDVATPDDELPDDLARQLVLHTDWLQCVRQDPHLPVELLPQDWPAVRAEKVFQDLAAAIATPARALAADVLDVVNLG
jgi:phenylacetic acid degradation operon negative regulatory protein